MYEKRTASLQILILRLMVPKIRKLQSDLVYPNCFVSSDNVGLARYPGNRNQTCSHGGHSGAIPPKFHCAPNFVLPRIFLLKNIAKTEVLTPKNVLCPRKPLDLGYVSGLSERSKGKQKQTVEQSQTNCQLKANM